MKIMFASDIHGSALCCEKMLEAFSRENARKLVLLGDILYHGPRNDLPERYAPKEVIPMLNGFKSKLLCVRGNCDCEVDQMVLDFPVMAEYAVIFEAGRSFFLTHGHHHSPDSLPPLEAGDVFIYGHTHILKAERRGEIHCLNPGSVSLPKNGNPKSYMTYEDGVFSIKELCGGETITVYKIC